MNIKVEVITDDKSSEKITESILKLLSKYEKTLIKDVQSKK